MDNYTATEQAYKNGYEQGKKDAVKHGWWLYKRCVVFDITKDAYHCSECKTTWDAESRYCPNCGARMDGE